MKAAAPSSRLCEHADTPAVLMSVFDGWRIGCVGPSGIIDVSDVFSSWNPSPIAVRDCIAEWPSVADRVWSAVADGSPVPLDAVLLRPPIPEPRNLFGAPVNFHAHRGEVRMDRTGEAAAGADARSRGFFVLSPSSIVGPSDEIELPHMPGREFAYEGEVAFIVGSGAQGSVPEAEAWDHIFGLTGFIDVTLRPSEERTEERSMRKSFHSFGPTGPWVMVTDSAPEPSSIVIDFRVNGDTRQSATLADLIRPVPELLSAASEVVALSPGDVFATGTPSGVGPIVPGDIVTLHVCPIGEMSLPVVERRW